ncbi:Stk1 family PASTA domain-containing Ser/Thr kinase [Bifidobacterium avesanii]|uniref:non-specific serine/threonine protein kinase n=1 Tax=Bifidobacterium avesanii TaxID=1798157 RepID=A0A7K3TJQ4_9BIFI|nr:Stk1 family PASTA domain-containing Ser/Thr kinase [Bifidobacterium avesanii]KAB8288527.1 serine/threonine protein kinase [Bifidobacterium avesanii]NEG79251.1 PASTA domain-containing protein [Bifidobacterium avesanii]
MSEAANQPVGQAIEGRYRVVRKIAEGGMATVYEAMDERLSRPVAIKIMHVQLAQGPHREQFQERFRREARSAAAIANPHIVQVYDTGEFNGLDYLVMEYVHGVNLRHEMNAEGTFTVRETLRIVGEILDGLSAAHRAGVVHRDIKPENILINERGHVQITDFGLAKAASQATLSSTGMLLGTAAYLAPEMIENNQATAQGDLYAVGIIAWEMLTGHVPFESDNPVTVVFKHVHEDVPSLAVAYPGVAPGVAAFVARLVARGVADRPADAIAAATMLEELRASLTPDQLLFRMPAPDASPDGGEPGPQAPEAPLPDGAARPNPTERLSETRALPPVGEQATQRFAMPPERVGANPTQSFADVMHANFDEPDAPQTGAGQHTSAHASTSATATAAHGGRRTAIIAGLVAAVLASAAGGYAWWYYLGPGSYWTLPAAADVTCVENEPCSIAGANAQNYLSTLTVAGIPYTQSEDYSDTVPSGAIISADPSEVGSRVSKRNGQQVGVVVSKGVRQATVPSDITNASSTNGKDPLTALKNAGFDNVTHNASNDQYSLTVPEGAAISVSAEPGRTYAHNQAITVVLSKGLKPVEMPTVAGLSQEAAKQALSDLNLTANVTEAFDDKIPAGTVVSASVQPGTQLKWNDSVDLVVSKGPQTATVPNVVGQQYDDAEKTLKALGFDVKKSSPLGDWTHTVRVQSVNAGDTVRVRDENGVATVITLTVA